MAPNWSTEKTPDTPPGGLYFFVDRSSVSRRRPTEKVEPGGVSGVFCG
jgi:hypothetical protein